MSLYLVKEDEIEFGVRVVEEPDENKPNRNLLWTATLHLDDAYTDFTYEELVQAFIGMPKRKKLGKKGEWLPFRIFFNVEQPKSMFNIMAVEDAVEVLMASHQNMELQLIVTLKFEDGFTISCKMDTKLPKGSQPGPYFIGDVKIPPTRVFEERQYRCHATVELIDKAVFEFVENSHSSAPFYKKLFEERKFCDFAIITENGDAIQCHKHFLAGRSPVFDRMLGTDCVETRESCCRMNVDSAVVNAFLQFIYCSDLKQVFESSTGALAVELMELGHKYDIQPLEDSTKTLLLNRDDEWIDKDVALKLVNYSLHKEGEDYQRLADKGRRVVELYGDGFGR